MPSFKQSYDEDERPSEAPSSDYYPGLYLSGKPADSLKGLAVGDEVAMKINVKVTSRSEHESKSGSNNSISLDVLSGDVVDEAEAKDVLFEGE